MTTIKTTCPRCGYIEATPEDITVVAYHGRSDGAFRCVCPECRIVFERYANIKVVATLTAIGCTLDILPDPQRQIEEAIGACVDLTSVEMWAELDRLA